SQFRLTTYAAPRGSTPNQSRIVSRRFRKEVGLAGLPCRGTSRRKIEELAGRCCSAKLLLLWNAPLGAPRIATRLPAVSHIASIKYPILLNDSALANDNKKLLTG